MQHSCDVTVQHYLSVQACAKVVPVAVFLWKEHCPLEVRSRADQHIRWLALCTLQQQVRAVR